MGRSAAIVAGAALTVLLLALYMTSRPQPAPPPRASVPEAAGVTPPPESTPLPAVAPREPEVRPEVQAVPAASRAATAAEPAAPQEVAPQEAAPGSAAVPLDKLLKWEEPRRAPRGVDLGRAAAPQTPAAAGSDPGLRDRVYLERRTDEVGPGDRERRLQTTDVGVRVPVASSVEVRGGVRIESRQDGAPDAATTEPTPTVGVGVRF